MNLEFSGEIVYWRGPAPYHFVTVPAAESAAIKAASPLITYGWGCIPVSGRIGGSTFRTSLFPRKGSGRYEVPVKADVRRAEDLELGDVVTVRLTLDV